MKLPALPALPGVAALQPVRADVVASENGRSLVMVNGRPVQLDGEMPAGESVVGKLSQAAGGGVTLHASEPAAGVDTTKLVESAGLPPEARDLVGVMREYGLTPGKDNLQTAAEFLKHMPGTTMSRETFHAIALMLSRRLDMKGFSQIKSYLGKELRFDKLFAGLDKALLSQIRLSWGEAGLVDALKELFKSAGAFKLIVGAKEQLLEEFAASLKAQQLLSMPAEHSGENRIYFSWPMFWAGQELPDTLEGEAFVPDSDSARQGTSLRILVEPPRLGKMEVSINRLDQALWIHFGASEQSARALKTIFQPLREAMRALGFEQTRLTIGRLRLDDNFFHASMAKPSNKLVQKVDLRA